MHPVALRSRSSKNLLNFAKVAPNIKKYQCMDNGQRITKNSHNVWSHLVENSLITTPSAESFVVENHFLPLSFCRCRFLFSSVFFFFIFYTAPALILLVRAWKRENEKEKAFFFVEVKLFCNELLLHDDEKARKWFRTWFGAPQLSLSSWKPRSSA